MTPPTFVIVGANLAGGAAASTLRKEGFHGKVVLVGEEAHPPYERPPLSKEYLRGEHSMERSALMPPGWYAENEVDLLLGTRATRVYPDSGVIGLANGRPLAYDKLLIATGGRNRDLTVPGHELDGIFSLRTIEDADRIRTHARRGSKAVVVGAGFIGCEVAASLRLMGVEVDVVEILSAPMARIVGERVGRVFEAIHREEGVRFHFGQAVLRFGGQGSVEEVMTTGGERIGCDFVVVGVGIEPATEVVDESGVAVENGVVVDSFCRTSVPGIYAAGDVANHYHPLFDRRIRVEHWDNALKQGSAAAKNMLDQQAPFDDPHWFWSDQYGHNLQCTGFAAEWDDLVVRGSLEERDFLAFYLAGGVVKAAVAVNRGKELRRARSLILAGRPIDPRKLTDEEVDLRAAAAAARQW